MIQVRICFPLVGFVSTLTGYGKGSEGRWQNPADNGLFFLFFCVVFFLLLDLTAQLAQGNQLEATVHLVLLPPVDLLVICLPHSQRLEEKQLKDKIYIQMRFGFFFLLFLETVTYMLVSSYSIHLCKGNN